MEVRWYCIDVTLSVTMVSRHVEARLVIDTGTCKVLGHVLL